MSLTLILGIAALLVLVTVWWGMARLRRIRAEEARRSEAALAELRAGPRAPGDPTADAVATFFAADFDDAHGSSQRALEVSEFDEGVDIEALLADERERVAQRSRETLAQITQTDVPSDEELASAPAAAPVDPQPAARVPPVLQDRAPPGVAPSVAASAPRAPSASMSATAASASGVAGASAAARPPAVAPLTDAPSRSFVGGGDLVRNTDDGPPLREVALAWFEARGYRSAPASPAVRPIERVLRHRQDATRGYAFVVESQPVSARRIEQLQALALSVGLKRLLVVAEAGAPDRASRTHRGVRLMDRSALAAELDRLDLGIAAKIIAVARKRSTSARL